MNIQTKDWDDEYKSCPFQKPEYDFWLDKHQGILEYSKDTPIIDLGCGLGNDSLYLTERGYQVISCDISETALERVKEFIPHSRTIVADMLKTLPFHDSSAKVFISDLSLHYFQWTDTLSIVNEIGRVLIIGGYLLCRLNSTKDVNHGAGQGTLIEKNYYAVDGNRKRFFDEEQIKELFCAWEIEYIKECQMDRYKYPKILWEVALKKQ